MQSKVLFLFHKIHCDKSYHLSLLSVSYVRPDADHTALYEMAVALFSLTQNSLTAVIIRDSTELVEETED